jgi:hypothetical protein
MDEQMTTLIQKIEEYCTKFYSPKNNSERCEADEFLTKLMQIENFEIFKQLLYNANSTYAKFYAANSLIILITNNYHTIKLLDKLEIYDSVLKYIVSILLNKFF